MKKLLVFISMCFVTCFWGITEVHAQSKVKVANKLVEAISRNSKRTIKKTKLFQDKKTSRKLHSFIVTCSKCKGSGKLSYWDSYAGRYQTVSCSKCNGSGKVRKYKFI